MSESIFYEYVTKYPKLKGIYDFYRGWILGVLDSLTDSNIEETHPGLDAVIGHVIISIIAETIVAVRRTKREK